MKRIWPVTAALLISILSSLPASAQEGILMVRAVEAFPETMLRVQEAITARGYQVTRVQRVDYGLAQKGYDVGRYRIVFYGRAAEIRSLARNHPRLIPFLPLKLTLYQQNDESDTMVFAANPQRLARLYPDPSLRGVFAGWAGDLRVILASVDDGTRPPPAGAVPAQATRVSANPASPRPM